MQRREAIQTLTAAGLAAVIPGVPAPASAQAAADAWPIKPLPFNPASLKGLSEKLLVSHHDNNYAGAARRIGQIRQVLADLPQNAPGFQLKGLKMEELIATNSAILHEEYFGNLGGDGKATGSLQQALARDFGALAKWEQDFRATSTALGGGSGWAILTLNLRDGKLHNMIAFDHTDNLAFGRPILINDMFEHAYHMDYGSAAAKYVDAFMQNVNWQECNRRYEEALKMFALLKK
ncbi:MAG TPA: Fe-Mn family superoxide dismutase [Terriglobia bacterium]|nr:Fe-Mn family superoxide dismutase [Terriglobia bacterium]